jgi:hypothetical protein
MMESALDAMHQMLSDVFWLLSVLKNNSLDTGGSLKEGIRCVRCILRSSRSSVSDRMLASIVFDVAPDAMIIGTQS